MVLGQTYDEQLFKSDMFRLFINTFADSKNGIINDYKQSCKISNTQNTVTIADGVFLLQGGLIQVQGNETVAVDLDNTCCILAFEIDLTKENTETEFNQGKFKIIKGTGSAYPTLQQDDIVNNSTGIYQMEFARFVADASGISNFVDKRVFIDFPTMFENINTQVTTLVKNLNQQADELIQELENKIAEAGRLPIDEDVYDSSDNDGNTFKLTFRRQGDIVSLQISSILQSGAFGQRIKSQLNLPNNSVPEKYKPRETINAKEDYSQSSGSGIANLGYLGTSFSENSIAVFYCNKDSFGQNLQLNLMYFGKEV